MTFLSILERRFIAVVGKGGVGRTTVSAALALAAASQGKRVLLAMCNKREQVAELLGVPPIGASIGPLVSGVDAVNIDPSAALEEYGMMKLKVRALYKAVLGNRFVAGFLRGTPGLEAWAVLGKAQFHALEEIDGRPRFDLVVLDAPATGHGLGMLRMPGVIRDVAPLGLLRREADRAVSLLTDPGRSAACLVSLAEDMPTNETLELYRLLRDELHMPVGGLVINRVLPRLFTPSQRQALAGLDPEGLPPGNPRVLWGIGARRAHWAEKQDLYRRRLLGLGVPTIDFPEYLDTPFGRVALEQFARAVRGSAASVERSRATLGTELGDGRSQG